MEVNGKKIKTFDKNDPIFHTIKVESDCEDASTVNLKTEAPEHESSLTSCEFIKVKEETDDINTKLELLSEEYDIPFKTEPDFLVQPSTSKQFQPVARNLMIRKNIKRKKGYHCPICAKNFSSPRLRTSHTDLHFRKRCQMCPTCGKCFNLKVEYFSHHCIVHLVSEKQICETRTSSVPKFIKYTNCESDLDKFLKKSECEMNSSEFQSCQCKVCLIRFKDRDVFDKHVSVNVLETPYKCDKCFKWFTLKCHQYTKCSLPPRTLLKCEYCPKQFTDTQKSRWEAHSRTHTGEKPFKCEICLKSFAQKPYLTSHIRVHAGERLFQCKICLKLFAQQSRLKSHMHSHDIEKPFECEICLKPFSLKYELRRHVRYHNTERSFKCDICFKLFVAQSHLTIHMRTHTGERPFKCQICSKSFSLKWNLTSHIRFHTGERSFKCEICSKLFTHKSNLTVHMRSHSGAKPFKCEICSKLFVRQYRLTVHMRLHTGKTV